MAEIQQLRSASLHDLIRGEIEKRITSGDWPPGHRIPYEHQLMADFGCSRMTVNKALATLVAKGLIERRKRAGTFVAAPQSHRATVIFQDIGVTVRASGQDYQHEILWQFIGRASAQDCQRLGTSKENILSLGCVHRADGFPFALEDRLINLDQVPEARSVDFAMTPPGAWLLAHVPWADAQHHITAIEADKRQAAALQVECGHACLSIERETSRQEQRLTFTTIIQSFRVGSLTATFCP